MLTISHQNCDTANLPSCDLTKTLKFDNKLITTVRVAITKHYSYEAICIYNAYIICCIYKQNLKTSHHRLSSCDLIKQSESDVSNIDF